MITAAARINTIHDRVRGHIDEDARRPVLCSRSCAAALGARHAAGVDSADLRAARRTTRPVREWDQYCREGAIMEPLLGMPAGWLPRDSAQFDAYMREMLTGGTHRRHRHQPGARTGHVIPAAVVRLLARISSRAAAHDRVTAASAAPGIRLRVARARRAGVRTVDGGAALVAAVASAVRTSVADGQTPEPSGAFTCTGRRGTILGGPHDSIQVQWVHALAAAPAPAPRRPRGAVDSALFRSAGVLVERRHEAVHRRDIFDRVWADVIVSESALSQAVRTLRRTLDDDPREPRFIRTVARHGYQFVCAEVVEEEDDRDWPAACRSRSARPPSSRSGDALRAASGSSDSRGCE